MYEAKERIDYSELSSILRLTASESGRRFLFTHPYITTLIIKLTIDKNPDVVNTAVSCLVNLTTVVEGAEFLLTVAPNFIRGCLDYILDRTCAVADKWAIILSNISRHKNLCEKVLIELNSSPNDCLLEKLVNAFMCLDFNIKKASLDYLGFMFCNLTQTNDGRDLFCNSETKLLESILTLSNYSKMNLIRRRGVFGVLRNICFDSTRHAWLFSSTIDILAYILYPLAGPEEFNDEIIDMLPIQLQFLPDDKQRESDAQLRTMLLEALAQLCATRNGRNFLRSQGTYEILRELHKWECKNVEATNSTDVDIKKSLVACENVVDILIRTEEEIGEDNLKNMNIPNDVIEKLEKLSTN